MQKHWILFNLSLRAPWGPQNKHPGRLETGGLLSYNILEIVSGWVAWLYLHPLNSSAFSTPPLPSILSLFHCASSCTGMSQLCSFSNQEAVVIRALVTSHRLVPCTVLETHLRELQLVQNAILQSAMFVSQ